MVFTRQTGNVLAQKGSKSGAVREERDVLGGLRDGEDPLPHVAGPQRKRREQEGTSPREEPMPGQAVEA